MLYQNVFQKKLLKKNLKNIAVEKLRISYVAR